MAVNDAYLNALADNGNPITHVGLVNSVNAEVGTERKAVTWDAAGTLDGTDAGDIRLSADQAFTMQNGEDVAGWQGYSALTGGTAYGINPVTAESFPNGGTYTLTGASTGVNHQASGA